MTFQESVIQTNSQKEAREGDKKMRPSDLSEAVTILAHGILKMQYPQGLPGMSSEDADDLFHRFVTQVISGAGLGALTPESVVALFEIFFSGQISAGDQPVSTGLQAMS